MRQLLATLRHRPAPIVGILVALIVAASVVTWAFSVGEAGKNSSVPAERLAATTIVVTGKPDVAFTSGSGQDATTDILPLTSYRRVPATVATELGNIPGIRDAVADRSVQVALSLPDGQVAAGTSAEPLTGYGWQSAVLTPFKLLSGHAPSASNQLVLGRGVARSTGLGVGDEVCLIGQPLSSFAIVGIAASPAGDPAGTWTVFFSGTEAAALYGHPGEADLIGIVAQPGVSSAQLTSRVRAAHSGQHLSVLSGSSRGVAEDVSAASGLSNLSIFGGGAGMTVVPISLFVVASTVAFSVAERARTTALLRAVGATPGQVRRMIMAELAVLGVLAGFLAYLPGTWLASLSVRGLVAHQFAPPSTHAWTSPVELVPSIAAAVVVAELAGLFAARRASRIRPAAALKEASIERRFPRPLRLVLGVGALGGGAVLAAVALQQPDASQQQNQALLVLLAFMAGIALLGPYLMVLAERILHLPLVLLGGTSGRLASADLRAHSRRMAAAAIAIALPVCFAGAITIIDATEIHAATTQARQRLAASTVVSAPGPGLNPSVLTAIGSEPGVTGAIGLVPTTVYVPYQGAENASAEAITPGPIGSVLNLGVTEGNLAHFGAGDVAVSTLIAGSGAMDVHLGETIITYLADGTAYRAKITAIFSRSAGFADVLVPTGASGGGHLGANDLEEVLVASTPQASPTALRSAIGSLKAQYQGLQVSSRTVANAQYELLNSQTSYANDLLLALVGLLAGVALVNILVVATLQGREELLLLRRVGATVRQLLAMTVLRAAGITIVGVVLGAAAQIAAVVAVSKALAGSSIPYIPVASAGVILGLVVLLVGTATLGPTLRLLARREVG